MKEKNIDLNHAENYLKKPVLYSPNNKMPATTVTYCYSAGRPALQPISYTNGMSLKSLNIDKPTVTIGK